MNHYETVFILNPVLSEDQMKETVQKFNKLLKDSKAKIVAEEHWGLKKMAYSIQKKRTGFYYLIEFSSDDIDEIPFKVGDSVKVIDGPFKEFNGLVQEVNDRNRIKVNVNIFGRPTPIELSVNQILSES